MTRSCSAKVSMVDGGCPIARNAVFPVPTPKKVRPGAKALIVAIPFAVTGANPRPGIATPGPMAMRWVRAATNASRAHTFERIIGLSQTQQKS